MDNSFDSSDDYGRGELFTPGRGRRKSLVHDFTDTPTPPYSTAAEKSTTPAPGEATNTNNNARRKSKVDNKKDDVAFFTAKAPNTLPKLQDTSWLGARMSPIRKRHDEIADDDGDEEDAAIVAPYRLGLTETSASSAASESFFLGIDDDTDDLEQNEQTKNNSNSGPGVQTSTIAGRGTSSNGYIRPRPPLLLHPHTTVNVNTNNSVGAAREKENDNSTNRPQRRRRRLVNPFQRKFRTFWSSLTSSSSSSPGDNDLSSSYVMVDPPRVTANGIITNICSGNFVVIGATAFVLFCVGLHDLFLAYIAMRRGITVSERLAWTLPWIGPTERSLLRFGAFCPERLLSFSSEYWRSLTSMFVTTSLVEWILLVWVWTRYLPSPSSSASNPSWQLSWPIVYLLSALTGQLWMVAFDYDNLGSSLTHDNYYDYVPTLSGCAGWATAGVLCAIGIQKPHRRFPCFISAIAFVILHQCQTTGSVIGCSAAAFFGWAFSGIWSPELSVSGHQWQQQQQQQRDLLNYDYTYHDILNDGGNKINEKGRWNLLNGLAAAVVILLYFLPIIYLLYR